MKIEDILALTKAGWSKDEIVALAAANEQTSEQSKDDGKSEQAPEGDASTESGSNKEGEGKESASSETVTLTKEQFNTLLQRQNLKNASQEVPQKKDLDFILGEHFKGVFGSTNKEGGK